MDLKLRVWRQPKPGVAGRFVTYDARGISEHASFPDDPELPREHVEVVLQRKTFDDWKAHQSLNDVQMLEATGVDDEIAYWECERDEGREPYED